MRTDRDQDPGLVLTRTEKRECRGPCNYGRLYGLKRDLLGFSGCCLDLLTKKCT